MTRRLETLFDRFRRRGDASALGVVFDRTAPELLRVAMHFARHPPEAEDLVQETFLTAMARAGTFDTGRPLMPWLVGILRNHARQLHRTRARRAASAPGDPEAPSSMEPWLDVEWTSAVAEAVAALQQPYRQVLVLRLQHEKAPAEIAVLLNVPAATVRSQLHRGLDLLRRRLPPEGRTQRLAALPMGAGLAGLRSRILAHASQHVGAASLTTSGLPLLGGALMVHKLTVGTGLVLVALLACGGLWLVGALGPTGSGDPPSRTSLDALAAGPDAEAPPAVPLLLGARSGQPAPDGEGRTAPASRTEAAWPPPLPIPADKGSVAGTLRRADGSPVRGALVALWGHSDVTSTTDHDGRYHLHADWVGQRSLYLCLGRPDQPQYLGLILSADVSMRGGELVVHDVVLEAGVEVASIVVDGRTGAPLAGVQVVLRRFPLRQGQASAGFLETGDDGRLHFPYVPRDTYTLALQMAGYEPQRIAFDLQRGEAPDRIAMMPARALVLRFEDLPEGAAGTTVRCDLQASGAVDGTSTRAVIDAQGTVTLDAPSPGVYHLTIYASSHLPRIEQDLELPMGPLDPVPIRIPPGARVVGTLSDADGAPLADVIVDIGGASGSTRTDASGGFQIAYAPAGARTLRARLDRTWVHLGSVDVPARGTVRGDRAILGRSTLEGRLLVDGVAPQAMTGRVLVDAVEPVARVATAEIDAQGQYRIPWLPAGTYRLTGWSSLGAPAEHVVRVGADEVLTVPDVDLVGLVRVPVRLVPPRGGTLPHRIHVTAYDAAKPDDIRALSVVQLEGAVWGVQASLLREADGSTWVTGLTRARHRLEFQAEGFAPALVEVDAGRAPNEPTVVQFELPAEDR